MSEGTRFAKVEALVAPFRQSDGTRAASAMGHPSTVAALFRDMQGMMASALQGELREGLFVFAAHRRYGHVARLWLQATSTPRAGMIGRHDAVDLALPLDDSLSLRHLMFVVL